MRSLGIDLAAQPGRTASCSIVWGDRSARVERLLGPGAGGGGSASRGPTVLNDDTLVELAADADRIGIDCPFGWPAAFVRAVAGWSEGRDWDVPNDPARRDLVWRTTDHYVAGQVLRPLSVSSDLIAIVAMRCAPLLGRIAEVRGEGSGSGGLDRSGMTGPVAEVYPAAALVRWWWFSNRPLVKGKRLESYKRPKGRAVLSGLVGAMSKRLPWLDLAGHEDELGASDDLFDALVASLVARAVALGLTDPPPPEDLDVARREGWIHLPHENSAARLCG